MPEYLHFELYYLKWYESFVKPTDPLVLFCHWCMIHHRFKCSYDSQLTDLLPANWNSSSYSYDLNYRKHDENYRMEIYLLNENIFFQLRQISQFIDSTQHIKIAEFINLENFKDKNYTKTYKNMDHLYERIKWSITHLKPKSVNGPKIISASSSSSTINTSTGQNNNNNNTDTEKSQQSVDSTANERKKNTLRKKSQNGKQKRSKASNPLLNAANASELLEKLKLEKEEYDLSVENNRISKQQKASLMSNSSSDTNLNWARNQRAHRKQSDGHGNCDVTAAAAADVVSETDQPNDAKNKNNIKCQRLNREDIYGVNYITHHFNYNTEEATKKTLDQKLMDDDEFVRNAFLTYKLKPCTVTMVNFVSLDIFKDKELPIMITPEMKEELKLNKPAVETKPTTTVHRSSKYSAFYSLLHPTESKKKRSVSRGTTSSSGARRGRKSKLVSASNSSVDLTSFTEPVPPIEDDTTAKKAADLVTLSPRDSIAVKRSPSANKSQEKKNQKIDFFFAKREKKPSETHESEEKIIEIFKKKLLENADENNDGRKTRCEKRKLDFSLESHSSMISETNNNNDNNKTVDVDEIEIVDDTDDESSTGKTSADVVTRLLVVSSQTSVRNNLVPDDDDDDDDHLPFLDTTILKRLAKPDQHRGCYVEEIDNSKCSHIKSSITDDKLNSSTIMGLSSKINSPMKNADRSISIKASPYKLANNKENDENDLNHRQNGLRSIKKFKKNLSGSTFWDKISSQSNGEMTKEIVLNTP